MKDLSLHVLDIVENSILAGATRISVRIKEERALDRLSILIGDDGQGMDEQTKARCLDPFYSSKEGHGIGLGLPLFAQAARQSGGTLEIESRSGGGAMIKAVFGWSHPDRKPLGDMNKTMKLLRISHPEIDFEYVYEQ